MISVIAKTISYRKITMEEGVANDSKECYRDAEWGWGCERWIIN